MFIIFKNRVHIKLDEKISLTCGKDGGVQNLEVLGVLSVRVASEDDGRIRIAIRNNDQRSLQIQTNPNVDKNLFKNNSMIGLRDSTKVCSNIIIIIKRENNSFNIFNLKKEFSDWY